MHARIETHSYVVQALGIVHSRRHHRRNNKLAQLAANLLLQHLAYILAIHGLEGAAQLLALKSNARMSVK